MNLSKKDKLLLILHRGAKVKVSKDKTNILSEDFGLVEWLAYDRAVMRFEGMAQLKENAGSLKKLIKAWLKASC